LPTQQQIKNFKNNNPVEMVIANTKARVMALHCRPIAVAVQQAMTATSTSNWQQEIN